MNTSLVYTTHTEVNIVASVRADKIEVDVLTTNVNDEHGSQEGTSR